MAKKNLKPRKDKTKQVLPAAQPWISMRNGLKIVAGASILMAVLTAWQVIPSRGWIEGILWGLLFGTFIWAIFFGNLLLNRFLRRK